MQERHKSEKEDGKVSRKRSNPQSKADQKPKVDSYREQKPPVAELSHQPSAIWLRRQGLLQMQRSAGNKFAVKRLRSDKLPAQSQVQRQTPSGEAEGQKDEIKHYGPLLSDVRKLSASEKLLLRQALYAAMGPYLIMVTEMANALGATVAIGLAGGGGIPAMGGGGGFGVYFGPSGEIGVYGGTEYHEGLQFSISGVVQYTIVNGGPEELSGECKFVGGGGDIGASVGGLVLLTMDDEFLGITIMGGVGAGFPFEFYAGQQETYAGEL